MFQWDIYPVELEICQLTKFPKSYQELFKKKNLNNMYCVKNFNYTIEGTFLYSKYSYMQFNFYGCDNKTSNNTCKDKKEIERYLNGTFISIEFTEVSIDTRDYYSPNTPIIQEGYSG